MKHLGDIRTLCGADLEPVHVITAGTPCQDLSVAGSQAGLDGARSILFLDFVRIVKEMREATYGKYPTFAVWENVPGAFSSNRGDDFRRVLEELAKIAQKDAVVPRPAKGWHNSGTIVGSGWRIAWRLLDAQFWGVPQRRRRIALVVDFGGERAAQILFERESLHGDIAPGGKTGQGAAGATERGVGGTGGEPISTLCLQGNAIDRDTAQNGCGICEDVAFTLTQTDRHAVAFMSGAGAEAGSIGYAEEVTPTLRAAESGANQVPSVCHPEAIHSPLTRDDSSQRVGAFRTERIQSARTIGYSETVAPTLRGAPSGDMVPAVVYDARGNGSGEVYGTITGDHNGSVSDCTALAVAPFDTTQLTSPANRSRVENGAPCHSLCGRAHVPGVVETYQTVTGPLMANSHPGSYCGQDAYTDMLVCMASGQANADILADASPTLTAAHEQPIAAYRVRRLTPLECERLQGYPDGWTAIDTYPDAKGRLKAVSDTVRYKALGNSLALPPWHFVLGRISGHLPKGATLGSLFDGIGGFPLVWERLHGRGTALWASEIEPFCIAVTQARFN